MQYHRADLVYKQLAVLTFDMFRQSHAPAETDLDLALQHRILQSLPRGYVIAFCCCCCSVLPPGAVAAAGMAYVLCRSLLVKQR